MIALRGGPADAAALELGRAPKWLRVVVAPDGTVDALDQIADEARPGEAIHVYELVGDASRVHVCRRGRGAHGGWYATGEYRHLAGVDGEPLRDTMTWREWCAERAGVPLQVVLDQLAAEASR